MEICDQTERVEGMQASELRNGRAERAAKVALAGSKHCVNVIPMWRTNGSAGGATAAN